jgi:hypothetical protein
MHMRLGKLEWYSMYLSVIKNMQATLFNSSVSLGCQLLLSINGGDNDIIQ